MAPQARIDEAAPGGGLRRIHINQNSGNKNPVFISVNGTALCIPRNREAVVPARYAEALKNAVVCVYQDDDDGHIDAPAYSFSDLGPA